MPLMRYSCWVRVVRLRVVHREGASALAVVQKLQALLAQAAAPQTTQAAAPEQAATIATREAAAPESEIQPHKTPEKQGRKRERDAITDGSIVLCNWHGSWWPAIVEAVTARKKVAPLVPTLTN